MLLNQFMDANQHQADDGSILQRGSGTHYSGPDKDADDDDDVWIGASHGRLGPASGDAASSLQVYSASVTLTARMAPGGNAPYGDDALLQAGAGGASRSAWWRVGSERLPLVAGVFCGGFLLALVVLAVLVYRCCIMPRALHHKHYCVRKSEEQQQMQSQNQRSGGQAPLPVYPSHSAVFADPKSGSWAYNSRLVPQQQQHQPTPGPSGCSSNSVHVPWPCGTRLKSSSPATPSGSNWTPVGPASQHHGQYVTWNTSQQQIPQGILKRGSVSGSDGRIAVALGNVSLGGHPPDIICSSTRVSSQVPRSSSHPGVVPGSSNQPHSLPSYPSGVSDCITTGRRPRPHSQPIVPCEMLHPGQDIVNKQLQMMPQICEFSAQPVTGNQYASSSILDEVGSKLDDSPPSEASTLKTRSLPAWVRSKPRPLSTEDDLAELYAKVNFSKKRKNRMRNDEAAIIALSKSRSQFLHADKDTDSLVDNEAVIVYDERTAL